MRPCERDVAIWLFDLTEKKIDEFKFKDLPNELQSRRMIQKARLSGLITKVSKDQRCISTWRLTKDGRLMAQYGQNYRKLDNEIKNRQHRKNKIIDKNNGSN